MNPKQQAAIKNALLTLERIAVQQNTNALAAEADRAAQDLRANLPAEYLKP